MTAGNHDAVNRSECNHWGMIMGVTDWNHIITCSLHDQSVVSLHTHLHIELFYMLHGQGSLLIGENGYEVQPNSIYIVPAQVPHAFKGAQPCLYARLELDPADLIRAAGEEEILLCESLEAYGVGQEALNQLRSLCLQMIRQELVQEPYADLHKRALSDQIMYLLLRHCSLQEEQSEGQGTAQENRITRIRNYILVHYNEPISLHDLAQYMYLSDTYLSKYFKNNLGQNFYSYLSMVRSEHAGIDLVRYPQRSTLQVAMDNGFPNVSSFNRHFQDHYHMTPSQYRKSELDKVCKERSDRNDELLKRSQTLIEEQIQELMPVPVINREIQCVADAADATPLTNNWGMIVNAGRLGDLLRSDIQEHILFLVHELHYQYVRVWDVFSDDRLYNLVDGRMDGPIYNFFKVDRIFDFLVRNHIRPFLELSFKPNLVLKNLDENILYEAREKVFSTLEHHDEFLKTLMEHLCKRYGEDEVNQWYLEIWWSRSDSLASFDDYLRLFEHTAEIVRQYAPGAHVGGAGFELISSTDLLKECLDQWSKAADQPDFLSIYAYPYTMYGRKRLLDGRRIQDKDYVCNWVRDVCDIKQHAGYGDTPLFVTEWNFSVSSRNIIHDSCYIGAYIIRNTIAMLGLAQSAAWWRGSDLHSEYYDNNSALYGGEGLLSRDGICKPSFYAFAFLNHMTGMVIGRGENYLIAKSSERSYRMICCNYQHPNIHYYQGEEDMQDPDQIQGFFTDAASLTMHIRIHGVTPGRYRIKTRRVNQEEGSVLDEWNKIRLESEGSTDDIAYLRNISIPRMLVQTIDCGQTLEFATVLKEHEIQYIHISRM